MLLSLSGYALKRHLIPLSKRRQDIFGMRQFILYNMFRLIV